MSALDYETMFIGADLSCLTEDIPELTLPIFLAVFFQQLALNQHDYVGKPLLSIIREFEFNSGFYGQEVIEEVPKIKPTEYFMSLIKQNKTLFRIHNYAPKLTLRQDYSYEKSLSQIQSLADANLFVTQLTEDDYFQAEVKAVYDLAKEFHHIMLEKKVLHSLNPEREKKQPSNKIKI